MDFKKFIQDDNFINTIDKIYHELINNYFDNDLIDVPTYQSKYCWFPMNYDEKMKKYIFNREVIDKYKEIYDTQMDHETFCIKFYIDAQCKDLRIFSKLTDNELAMYDIECKNLMINKEYVEEFNLIREKIYDIFDVEKESYYQISLA